MPGQQRIVTKQQSSAFRLPGEANGLLGCDEGLSRTGTAGDSHAMIQSELTYHPILLLGQRLDVLVYLPHMVSQGCGELLGLSERLAAYHFGKRFEPSAVRRQLRHERLLRLTDAAGGFLF